MAELASAGSCWYGSSVKEFEVMVSIIDVEGLKPGYSCEVEWLVDEAQDVRQIPVQAVFREADQLVAWVEKGGQPERRPIVIGRSSLTHVEVLEGLKEGERVLLARPEVDDA